MDDSPLTILASKYGRYAKRNWRDLVGAAGFDSGALDLKRVRQIRRHNLRDPLGANGFATAELGSGAVQGLLDLVPTTGRGAEGVGEGDVAAPRRQLLIRLGVSLHERIDGLVILLNDLPEVGCRHFDASSIASELKSPRYSVESEIASS
jgi:hypothetical protein